MTPFMEGITKRITEGVSSMITGYATRIERAFGEEEDGLTLAFNVKIGGSSLDPTVEVSGSSKTTLFKDKLNVQGERQPGLFDKIETKKKRYHIKIGRYRYDDMPEDRIVVGQVYNPATGTYLKRNVTGVI
jgi:hypothetical protein